MFEFNKNGKVIEVIGWDSHNGDEDVLFGEIRACENGNYLYHAAHGAVLTASGILEIARKLSQLNSKR